MSKYWPIADLLLRCEDIELPDYRAFGTTWLDGDSPEVEVRSFCGITLE